MKATKNEPTNRKERLESIKAKIKELEKYEAELRNLYQNLRLNTKREDKKNDIDNVVGL